MEADIKVCLKTPQQVIDYLVAPNAYGVIVHVCTPTPQLHTTDKLILERMISGRIVKDISELLTHPKIATCS